MAGHPGEREHHQLPARRERRGNHIHSPFAGGWQNPGILWIARGQRSHGPGPIVENDDAAKS
jgi:hypothetical protein